MAQTGSYWVTGERSVSLKLTDKGAGCEASADGSYSGVIHRDTKDILQRIATRLEAASEEGAKPSEPGKESTPGASAPDAQSEQTSSDNTGPSPRQSSGAGAVELTSNPSGAEVYLDGAIVGDTLATLALSPSKDDVRLSLTGYKDWRKNIKMLAASSVTLAATLEKQ